MTEINQSAKAPEELQTIRKSVSLSAEGSSLQIACLELSVPSSLEAYQMQRLELECASLMRTVASMAESVLFGGSSWTEF